MPKGTIKKNDVVEPIFTAVVYECGSSIRKLGACDEIECTERTIRRSLKEGKMTPRFLDQIAKHLDVDSRLLSGELHKKVDSYSDEALRSICVAQLKAKNYPYYRKRKTDFSKQPIEELLEQILALFEISFSQFEEMDFDAQYHLQHDLLDALVPIIRKHFRVDAYGRRDMPDLERIICELENFRDDHYIHI